MSKSRVDWVWAVPPSAELRSFSAALVRGELPSSSEVVKENRPRTVWRIPDVAGGLLVKHYRVQAKDALRALVTPGRAEREYRAMESLCSLDLPTVQPLGYADHRKGLRLQEAWFIARLVAQAQTLSEALGSGEGDPWSLASQAAHVVAKLHEHRVLHRDLHAGNLLLDPEGRLLIIDLHSMWRVPRLTRAMRMGNLAHLLHSMRGWLDLDEAPRFIAEYARARGEPVDQLVPQVRRSLELFQQDYVRGRSARCMRNSSEFVGEAHHEGRVHRLRRYPVESLREDLEHHREATRLGGAALLGDAPRCRVSLRDDEAGARVVKEYVDRSPSASWRCRLGFGKARGAWKASRRCQVVGVPTPVALALIEAPDGSAHTVTEAVHGARPLDVFADELEPHREVALRHAVAREVGRVVGVLSRAGLRHDDMSTKNWLLGEGSAVSTGDLRTDPPPGMPSVQLIDLDNMKCTAPHDESSLARMLGQLGDLPAGVTRTDLARFSHGFFAGAGQALPRKVVLAAQSLTRARRERRAARERELAAGPPA
ncbi:MAG: lipopolysaccharide kinase InaA family protein [Planctomycetota bacterium]|nr:lipopolysaccharide kinase InaA family protein [Planctomycetota bacterium]